MPRCHGLTAALAATAAAVVLPGLGHLLLRRHRTGALILGAFLAAILLLFVGALSIRRREVLAYALSARTLGVVAVASLVVAVVWISVIIRTYLLAKPVRMGTARKILGAVVVAALCLVVAVPFGFTANLVNSQRNLLDAVFRGGGGGTSAVDAIKAPRLNILLLGSDAGPDRTGTRTDTMMVASVDTHTAKTILFGLPRNIERARFPAGSPMALRFPDGFHDPRAPLSGNYLLNAVYTYAQQNPDLAPSGPSADPGLNLLGSTVGYMLGLPLDYYLEIDMAGFASLIDAVGGVTVDVGPTPIPINGVTADGRHITPTGYIQPGVQKLDGEDALWFARSRRDSTDYDRMGRQRCLINAVLDQKSPADLLGRFRAIAAAATDNVSTNIPQDVLPKLASLAGDGVNLQSVTFDPNLVDPGEPDGHFNPAQPDVGYMRQVVAAAISGRTSATSSPTTTPRSSTRSAGPTTQPPAPAGPTSTAPIPVGGACAAAGS